METIAPGNTPSAAVNQASESAHEAVNSMAGAAEEAVSKARPTIDHVAAMAHQAVDKAANAAAPTLDWLAEQGAGINASQKKLVANTCAYVSANPLQAIGIALASGFVLGCLLRRE